MICDNIHELFRGGLLSKLCRWTHIHPSWKSSMSNFATTTSPVDGNTAQLNALYTNTSHQLANLKDTEIYLQQETYKNSLFVSLGFLAIIGSVAIWTAFEVYNAYANYKDLIDTLEQFPSPGVSGKRLALCLQFQFYNRLFGISKNIAFAASAWVMFYSSQFRQQIDPTGDNFGPNFAAALARALVAADTNPAYDAVKIACIATGTKPDDPAASNCYPKCKLSTSYGQTSSTLGAAQGALSLGAMGGGIALAAGAAAGPVGWVVVGAFAVLGGIFGGIKAHDEKQKALAQCQNADATCYKPTNFPPCSQQVS